MSEELFEDGRKVERDPDTGQFQKVELSSEQAAEFGRRSGEARRGATQNELLEEAGYDPPSSAPAYVKLMGAQATKSHTAMRDWRRFAGQHIEAEYAGELRKPERGEVCALCGRGDQESELMKLIAVLDAVETGD